MKHPVVMPHLGATGGDVRIVESRVGESALVAAGAVLLVVETDSRSSTLRLFAQAARWVRSQLREVESLRATRAGSAASE